MSWPGGPERATDLGSLLHANRQRLLVPNNEGFLLRPFEVLVNKLKVKAEQQSGEYESHLEVRETSKY